MSKRLGALVAIAIAAATFAAACSDRPRVFSAPEGIGPTADLVGGTVGAVTGTTTSVVNATVKVVTRTVPLAHDVTWSFVASPLGSTSANAVTGLAIRVPAGAVSAPTLITVTAPAGAVLDYQFAPQGLRFAKPLTLTQNLSLTNVIGSLATVTLRGAYYASDALQYDPATGTALVNEFETTRKTLLPPSVSFDIWHFSGYIVACDASGGPIQ